MSKQTNEMDCAQFQEIVHDLDRPGTQEMGLREPALAHAESCSDCAQRMTEGESLSYALRTMGVRDAGQNASPRVEAALLQEFRRVNVESARRRLQSRVAALATAAIVLLAVGLSLRHPVLRASKPSASAATKQTATQTLALSAAEAVVTSGNPTATNGNASSEYASSYVSLPYADDPSTLGGGAIVRVELSRAALEALGLPVADMSDSDQVAADVVLSEDGAPQAIRLVAQASAE